jgi:hypothetical protein
MDLYHRFSMIALKIIRVKGGIGMKPPQIVISNFPGQNHGHITVLTKKAGQQGYVQLSFDLSNKALSKE